MRFSRLYVRIFLSFLAMLVVVEILIFGHFLVSSVGWFHSRLDEFAGAHALIAKQLVEEKIRSQPEIPIGANGLVTQALNQLAAAYQAGVWLTDTGGATLAGSSRQPLSKPETSRSWKHVREYSHVTLFRGFRKGPELYAVIPVMLAEDRDGKLHILFEKRSHGRPEGGFLLGLVVIGGVVALLVLPLSRTITRRLGWLRDSANRLAEGELSHRAQVKGRDEIGELGRAFNRMAVRLQTMIEGNRELTANISHELRSPLARIRLAEELLRRAGQASPGIVGHLDDIREDVDALDRLVGRILDLAKMDFRAEPLKPEPTDPRAVITEILGRLAAAAEEKNLQVSEDGACDRSVMVDREGFRTALFNILENAVKYTPQGGRVAVRLESGPRGIMIAVTNPPQSLPDDDLERIFEPFYRKEGGASHGSGLGLAIARKAVERHGGTIKAANTPDGLEITMVWPWQPGPEYSRRPVDGQS